MDKKEIWVNIPDYEGLYKVSNLGNVFGIKNKKLLKKRIHGKGYTGYVLTKNGIAKDYLAHRLVLKSFIGDSKLTCNHIDGIKNNNYLNNLEYCTQAENNSHAIKTGLTKYIHGEKHPLSKLSDLDVSLIRKLRKEYNIKVKTLAILFGIHHGMAANIIYNKRRCHI